jgi:hypothetical protein
VVPRTFDSHETVGDGRSEGWLTSPQSAADVSYALPTDIHYGHAGPGIPPHLASLLLECFSTDSGDNLASNVEIQLLTGSGSFHSDGEAHGAQSHSSAGAHTDYHDLHAPDLAVPLNSPWGRLFHDDAAPHLTMSGDIGQHHD